METLWRPGEIGHHGNCRMTVGRGFPIRQSPGSTRMKSCASTSRSGVRGIAPIVDNPRRWPRPAMELSGPIAFDSLVGIRTTVKDQYPGVSGYSGGHEHIERKGWYGVSLEASHPGFGPPVFFTESVGKIDLRRLEMGQRPVSLGVELVHCELHGVRSPSKYGRIADVRTSLEDEVSLYPIVDDATFARHVVEETVYVSRNHDIQIHEQAFAAGFDQIVREQAQLEPRGPCVTFR